MDVLGTQNISEAAIVAILHHGLAISRFKHSRLPASEQRGDRPTGAVFLTRSKEALQEAVGFVSTSQEAILDNDSCSHWTPNIFRFGTYKNPNRHVISGHSEDNLKQINTFVVDADFGDHKPSYSVDLYHKFIVTLDDSQTEIWPTILLETPHGYQAYYVLDRPVFVRRHNDQFPAITAAKMVSEAIRTAVAEQLPQVDPGANHFGFFRKPNEQNVCFFEPSLTHDFGGLLAWAKRLQASAGEKDRVHFRVKQTDQPWFIALTRAQVSRGDGMLGRNNTLLTLCLAGYSSGWTERDAYDYADQWNSGQREPLSDREVQRIVHSAFSGKYQGANAHYIAELTAAYAPDAAKPIGNQVWRKHAKVREDRQYSHLREWAEDLVKYVNTKTGREADYLQITTRELRSQLGISSQMLMRVLHYVADLSLLKVVRKLGRNGGLSLATLRMAGRTVQRNKRASGDAWRFFLDGLGISREGTSEKIDQLSLWPGSHAWSGP
ncbi:primase C-terminal domain-containing protein [Lacticaseibacillus paracasei]|uniref:primase C-terminal domain-containing protein n=1 Tax=Lacticaseibacillus paracasei TaxID=1597 RepID=UPI002ADEB08E|nr:primase C-terminal domain-containing protein [Lacticaseibacillus paracasei]MEA0974526.1 primase C-terminal domain-containing protein [Lacticaseibacillus paracasei]